MKLSSPSQNGESTISSFKNTAGSAMVRVQEHYAPQRRCSPEMMDVSNNLFSKKKSGDSSKECKHKEEHNGVAVRRSRKRRFRFDSKVSVLETIHVNDMTDEEIRDCWYDSDDYANMKVEFNETVGLMIRQRRIPSDATSRGLEYRHPNGMRVRNFFKWSGLSAVLEEQQRQRVLGIQNDELLSQEYKKVAERCLIAAQKRGNRDASILNDEPTPSILSMKWSDMALDEKS